MTTNRWWKFLASPELGTLSTFLFAGLYTWPLLTFTHAGATFRFTFIVWSAHILLIALTSHASRRLEASQPAEPTL
jgi:nitrate reductase NapE component